MKKLLVIAALHSAGLCVAQEVGKVLSSIPVIQQVAVPRQVCTTQQVEVQRPNTGAGAAIGAIAGAALGDASGGHGSARAAATMIGAIGGAVVGNNIEGQPQPQVRDVQRCSTQMAYENRVVGYRVDYEYAGKRYSAQIPQDPGPTVQVQITPVSAVSPPPPVYVPPPPVVVTAPEPVYYERPNNPQISVDIGVGGYGGRRRW